MKLSDLTQEQQHKLAFIAFDEWDEIIFSLDTDGNMYPDKFVGAKYSINFIPTQLKLQACLFAKDTRKKPSQTI